MKPEVKIITCPKCGTRQEFTMYPTINGNNPDLREKFLDGSLTTISCSKCGFSGVVEYPMFYHDMENKYSVFFHPDSDERSTVLPPALPAHLINEFTLRLVHTQDEFREKIFIFRDKLDDRIIELVKDAVLKEMESKKEAKMPEALFYAQDIFECEGRSLIFVPRKGKEYFEPIKVPFKTYEDIKKMMHCVWERDSEGYFVVDKEWIAK